MLRTPHPFIKVEVHAAELSPSLTGISIGYEGGVWRHDEFARHLIDWLPEFALSWSEIKGIGSDNLAETIRRAAQRVYSTDNYSRRGEIGEIILHMVLRQVFGTDPLISKIYFKDAANDTVKGFDAVHIVVTEDHIELWLGEVKFYSNIDQAIRAVIVELENHLGKNYLRSEFAAIRNKVDSTHPQKEKLEMLLHENTSLDQIIDRLVIPVLLTYDSTALSGHTEVTQAYKQDFKEEIAKHHQAFAKKMTDKIDLVVKLILVPLSTKEALTSAFDARLHHAREL